MEVSDSQLRALIAGTLPDEQVSVLEEAIGNSPELLKRLEKLSGASQFKEEFSVAKNEVSNRWSQWLRRSDESESIGRLGEFEIQEEIASGGMGVVFRGIDHELDRTVAVKMLLPHYTSSDEAKERFIREATAAATVEHEHVLPIYTVDKTSALLPFFVMRYVEGESLDSRLRREGKLRIEEIVRIGLAVSSGLAVAHRKG